MTLICGRPPRSTADPFFESWGDSGLALPLRHWDLFGHGVCVTVELTTLSLLFGLALAFPAALALARRTRLLAPICAGWVYLFRGSPLLVQVYLIYYGLSQFDSVRASSLWPILREPYWCALIAFTLNTGAYTAEILRGAIAATPRGEIEGARALGLSRRRTEWLVVIPSALRRAIPQYGNEVIFMMHGSVVASVITIQDILGVARTVNGKYYVAYEGFIPAALLYMTLTFLIVFAFRGVERRYLSHLALGR